MTQILAWLFKILPGTRPIYSRLRAQLTLPNADQPGGWRLPLTGHPLLFPNVTSAVEPHDVGIYIIKIGRFVCRQRCDWSARSAGRARAQRGPVTVFKPKTSVASFRLVCIKQCTVSCTQASAKNSGHGPVHSYSSAQSQTKHTINRLLVSRCRVYRPHDVGLHVVLYRPRRRTWLILDYTF